MPLAWVSSSLDGVIFFLKEHVVWYGSGSGSGRTQLHTLKSMHCK
jgi:hypothetical protein